MREELERFRRRVLHVRRILSDPNVTRFTLVTIPEKMGVNETIRANTALREFDLPVSGCVINRMTPDLEHAFIQTRRNNERANVEELREGLEDMFFHEVELRDTDIHGIENLRSVASELHPEIVVEDGLGPFEIGLGLEVNRGTWRDGDVVSLHLPGIAREDLSLRSESGVVYVGINNREHPVDFPRPAKASEVQAKLEDDVLRLTFPSE